MKTSPLIRVGLAALVVALVGVTLMGAGRARAAVLEKISQGTYIIALASVSTYLAAV